MARKKDEEENGGGLGGPPNKKYEQFFSKFAEIETLPVSDWKTVHMIAYFCKKYEEHYKTKYLFKYNSPNPTNCYEVYIIKKIASLMSSNPKILKEYVDWVYKTRVVEAKRKLTSISFMAVEGLINEYKMKHLFADKKDLHISRATELPAEYRQLFTAIGVRIQTYGDLAFIVEMDDKSSELVNALTTLQELGFDMDVLKRVI